MNRRKSKPFNLHNKFVENIDKHLESIKDNDKNKKMLFNKIKDKDVESILRKLTDVEIQQKFILLLFKIIPCNHMIVDSFSSSFKTFFNNTLPSEFNIQIKRFLASYNSNIIGRSVLWIEVKNEKIKEEIYMFLNENNIKIYWKDRMIIIKYTDIVEYTIEKNIIIFFVKKSKIEICMEMDYYFKEKLKNSITTEKSSMSINNIFLDKEYKNINIDIENEKKNTIYNKTTNITIEQEMDEKINSNKETEEINNNDINMNEHIKRFKRLINETEKNPIEKNIKNNTNIIDKSKEESKNKIKVIKNTTKYKKNKEECKEENKIKNYKETGEEGNKITDSLSLKESKNEDGDEDSIFLKESKRKQNIKEATLFLKESKRKEDKIKHKTKEYPLSLEE
ncbi:hypothetical protein SLOPH_501, partial [Spraguea lophii 42_110]